MKKMILFLSFTLTTLSRMNADSLTDQIQQIKEEFYNNARFKQGIEKIESSKHIACQEKVIECMQVLEVVLGDKYTPEEMSHLHDLKNKLGLLIAQQQTAQQILNQVKALSNNQKNLLKMALNNDVSHLSQEAVKMGMKADDYLNFLQSLINLRDQINSLSLEMKEKIIAELPK